jgi:hypothetical protein
VRAVAAGTSRAPVSAAVHPLGVPPSSSAPSSPPKLHGAPSSASSVTPAPSQNLGQQIESMGFASDGPTVVGWKGGSADMDDCVTAFSPVSADEDSDLDVTGTTIGTVAPSRPAGDREQYNNIVYKVGAEGCVRRPGALRVWDDCEIWG